MPFSNGMTAMFVNSYGFLFQVVVAASVGFGANVDGTESGL